MMVVTATPSFRPRVTFRFTSPWAQPIETDHAEYHLFVSSTPFRARSWALFSTPYEERRRGYEMPDSASVLRR
jgi:hypothetical protein